MPASSEFLILRRFTVGDDDLLVKAYGQVGRVKLFVPKGASVEGGYVGLFEPFNIVDVSYKQSGQVLLVKDIRRVVFLSYLALQSYSGFIWMSRVGEFVEKWFFQYEPELFSLAIEYLQKEPNDHELGLLKLKLSYLQKIGLYKLESFQVGVRPIVNRLLEEDISKLSRIRLSKKQVLEIEKTIDTQLSSLL